MRLFIASVKVCLAVCNGELSCCNHAVLIQIHLKEGGFYLLFREAIVGKAIPQLHNSSMLEGLFHINLRHCSVKLIVVSPSAPPMEPILTSSGVRKQIDHNYKHEQSNHGGEPRMHV